MRRLFLAIVLVLLLPATLLQAQPDNCDINLESAITTLLQAQRAADGGNDFEALESISTVQASLAGLVAACQGVAYPLPQQFSAPDDRVAFAYPDGWRMSNPEPSIYLLVNDPQLQSYEEIFEIESLASGDQIIILVLLPAAELAELGSFESFEDFTRQFSEEIRRTWDATTRQDDRLIQGRSAHRYRVSLPEGEGYLDLIDTSTEEGLSVALVMGFSAPGELRDLAPILAAFEESLQVPVLQSLRPQGPAAESLRYEQAVPLTSLSEDIDPRSAVLSPDGSQIAWYDRNQDEALICRYLLAESSSTCLPLPERFASRPMLLQWSHDGRYLAFTQDFFRMLHEPDIWVLDVVQEQLFNRTDDEVEEWSFGAREEQSDSTPLWLDMVIAWGYDGNLYVLRNSLASPDTDIENGSLGLYRLAPDGGEPTLIRDLTGVFSFPYPVAQLGEYALEGAMAFSPDMEQLAFIVTSSRRDDPQNGIWVMPLDGSADPRQLSNQQSLAAGMPATDNAEDVVSGIFPYALAWDGGGEGLYLLTTNPTFSTPIPMMAYYLDASTGAVSPLLDFSSYAADEMVRPGEDGRSPSADSIRSAVLAPDGSGLLGLSMDFAGSRSRELSLFRPEGDGWSREVLNSIAEPELLPASLATAAYDGKLLIMGYLYLPESP